MNQLDTVRRKIRELRAEASELEGMLSDATTEEESPPSVSLPEMVKEPYDVEWIVGGLIPAGTTGMLVADPHIGKSTLAIQLSLAVASGHNTLGFRIVKPRRVLYCFAEGARALVAERVRACARSSGIEIPPTGFVQAPTFRDFNVMSPGFRRLVEHAKPDLTVLDALGYFFSGNENSAVEWKQGLMAPLRALTAEFGTAFCVIHHQTKANPDRQGWQKARGTGAMFADVDFFLRMEPEEGQGNENVRRLIVDKQKYGSSGQVIPLVFDKPGAYFSWL